MEIDAESPNTSKKVIELKLNQPDARQEQADSAHSQNSRYQSSESFKCSESKSSGSSGYCGKPNSAESSPYETEKETDSCDRTEAQAEASKRQKLKERDKEFCKLTSEIFEDEVAINNELPGCDAVVACENPIEYYEVKQTLDLHEVLLATHENEPHNENEKIETSENHERINNPDGTTAPVHINFENIIDIPDAHHLTKAESELPMMVEEIQGYSDGKLNCSQPESFCCTVSMHDGTIMAVTEHLTNLLGFPHDSWIGQPFVNFLHPKDRVPFANKMRFSVGSGSDYGDGDYDRQNAPENTTYALMRYYRLFESLTFGIPCRKVIYKPFKLILHDAPMMPCESMSVSSKEDHSLLRFICAVEIKSIYKVPDEDMSTQNQRFSTKHTATGVMVHIDGTAIDAIGYLPHEIIGRNIFDFYHPSDLGELRNVYETLAEQSSISLDTISGKPYRFLIKNGCYITIETKWRRTFNPWTRKVEFIIGAHCILKGPKHCNIFTEPGKYACNYSDETMKNAERIQNEITRILAQPIPLPPANKTLLLSKQSLELTKYMEKFRNEVKKKEHHLLVEGNLSHSERPIMGHHSRYDDSENSSETPPTYQMLNYQENMNRYFNSNPVESMTTDFDLTDLLNEPVFKLSPVQEGSDKSGASGKLSVCSVNSKEIEPLDQALTSELMNQHTKEMETMLIKSRIAKNHKTSRMDNNHDLNDLNVRHPGIKRSHPSTSESELNATCPKHQYKDLTQKEAQPERLIGPINQIALLNNFNFVPVVHYVSATAPVNYANDVEGIRLADNGRDWQTFTNANGGMPSLISCSNAQNTHAIQYMNNLLNQSRQSINGHMIYPYPSLMFKPLSLAALHTNGNGTEMEGQITNQPECLSKRTATSTKETLAKYSHTKHVTEKIEGKLLGKSKEKDETECSCSTFYSSQLRTVKSIKIENPVENCRQQDMLAWYEDKVRSQRLPWSENVYGPDFEYRIQHQDPNSEIQKCVEAMKHMEQSNLVGDQLNNFLSGPAFNGRQPYVSVSDTPSVSGDDEFFANLIAVQCQSVEALLYEENAAFF